MNLALCRQTNVGFFILRTVTHFVYKADYSCGNMGVRECTYSCSGIEELYSEEDVALKRQFGSVLTQCMTFSLAAVGFCPERAPRVCDKPW